MRAIDKAVEVAGGQAALAILIDRPRAFVNQMVGGSRPVPVKLRPIIEEKTGIRCEEFGSEVDWIRDRKGKVTGYHVAVGGKAA